MPLAKHLAACALLATACSSTPATGPGGLHVGDTIVFDRTDLVLQKPVAHEASAAVTSRDGVKGQDGMGWSNLLEATYTNAHSEPRTARCVVGGWEDGKIVLEGDVARVALLDLDEVPLVSVFCPHR